MPVTKPVPVGKPRHRRDRSPCRRGCARKSMVLGSADMIFPSDGSEADNPEHAKGAERCARPLACPRIISQSTRQFPFSRHELGPDGEPVHGLVRTNIRKTPGLPPLSRSLEA